MAIKLCHHIKEDGIFCQGAALHDRDYCYAHLTFRGRRMRAAQQQARGKTWRLDLPPLEDLNAVQVAIMQVLDAITGGRIERHDAGHLLYGLQTAASNLRGKDRVSFEVSPSAENRCPSYDSFEEDFELTDDATTASGSAADAGTPTVGDEACPEPSREGGEPVAAKKETATELANTAPLSPIIIEKLMAVAEDYPADSPASSDLVSAEAPEAPRKPPRGLRPPNAQRQSAEEAAAAAKEVAATAEECGRLDGKVQKCRDCQVQVYKRLAQYWESRSHPPDWLPSTGTMECLGCQLKHLTTLGRHLDEKMPPLFEIYVILRDDGGEDPGEFDDYFCTLTESLAQTGGIPEEWSKRFRAWRERDGDSEGDAAEEGNEEEETEASA